MRPAVVPLHWRVRLAMWLPAAAGTALAAVLGPLPLALGGGAALAGLILLWGEPVVQAVRRQAQAPAVPLPAEPAAAMPTDVAEALARALEQGGVTVLYRPLRSLPERSVCGVEAELRWRHPLAGLLPPPDWPRPLPPGLAERLLDRWLVEACTQFARWGPRLDTRDAGQLWLPLPAIWLEAPGLEEALDRAVTVAGLPPERLRLRCTPQLQGRVAVLPEPLQRLQQRGFGLAADAFGAGAASLAHLTELPLRAVCLDRSFVERAAHAAPQRLVVESTARLAASLGMQTLADGIVGEAQVAALGAMGCQLGLGEACGPWLEAADWTQRWAEPRFADTGADATAL